MRTLVLLVLVGCASTPAPVPDARFTNSPPVVAVNDRRDVPKPPRPRDRGNYLYNFDGSIHRRVTRAMELHRDERARGINALDEVPNSTWFTNRIGVRDISPAEIAAAPGGVGSPEPYKPWTILSSKARGASVGFIIKDSRGEKWLLKFEQRGYPEVETANQVIMGKLLWAFGFNVTEDYVVHVRRDELVLAPDAKIKNSHGNAGRLDKLELDRRLARVDVSKDGRFRALVSHWLQGVPLGGHSAEGTRKDDPNDQIPHELRRDLRGAYALFSWLDHNDIHQDNMLDMWVADPADPRRHYVKHYWVDYGQGLGLAAALIDEPRYGYEWFWDPGAILRSFVTLGLVQREWEKRTVPGLRGVAWYDTTIYDPGTWKSSSPAYVPIYLADRIDKFWASKIIMKLTRDQLVAVVATAKLSDPRAAAWLVDALIARQRATAKYWFERVNPLDEFGLDGTTLCFKDLSIVYAFTPAIGTNYTLTFYDRRGTFTRGVRMRASDGGVACAPVALASGPDDYTVVRIDTERPGFHGTTYVHIALDPARHTPRVIGIWRS